MGKLWKDPLPPPALVRGGFRKLAPHPLAIIRFAVFGPKKPADAREGDVVCQYIRHPVIPVTPTFPWLVPRPAALAEQVVRRIRPAERSAQDARAGAARIAAVNRP